MYRARSFFPAIVAALFTAAAFTTMSWGGAALAAGGTGQGSLWTMLTTGAFGGLEWPLRTDNPPVSVHVTFYLAVVLAAIVAGVVCMIAARKASPRNGAAAFVGTWLGVVIGAVLAAVLVYFMRVDALAAGAADRNGILVGLLQSFAYGGAIVGWVPALASWITFKLANRTRAAQYTEAMIAAEGGPVDENPFDLSPGSIGDPHPVEPGFTYPAGDYHDGSYKDADLSTPAAERAQKSSMTFSDPTDATGEDYADRNDDDFADRSDQYGINPSPRAGDDAPAGATPADRDADRAAS